MTPPLPRQGSVVDHRLRRVVRHGYTAAYATRDGHFEIENGLAGMDGGSGTPWTIRALDDEAAKWLHAAGEQPFSRKRDAVEYLRLSVYDYASREVIVHGDGAVTVDGAFYAAPRVSDR